ncbi:ubiquitin-like domain-containing protein [Virgibacillus halodenitrificans]|uniref:ubiquitin-like domain-containing protein n=1 Tax=Virgibacillus halodenitrificans TaxID=1482 RepID=UPI0030B907DD
MRIFSKLMPASKMKLVISSIGVLALVVFSGFVLFEASKAEVIVIDNGEKQTVKTHADTVKGLLAEAGISVGEHDELSHEQDTPIEAGMEIDYKTANKVIISIDGEEKEYYTTKSTIKEFLAENNLEFTDHDAISHKSSEAIQDGLHIDVKKAYQITIKDGKKDKKSWTTGGSVKDLLAEANIDYDDDDKIEPGLDKQVDKDMTIKVIDVEKVTDEVTESIAFETEKKMTVLWLRARKKLFLKGRMER